MNNRTRDRNLSLESTKETDMKCVQNFGSEVDIVQRLVIWGRRFLPGARQDAQTDPWTHPPFYPIGTWGFLSSVAAANSARLRMNGNVPPLPLHAFMARTETILHFNFFFLTEQPPVGQGLLIHDVSRSHTTTHNRR
jgi:hypothetical protein